MALYDECDWWRLVADFKKLLDQTFEDPELVSVAGGLMKHTSRKVIDKSGKSGYSGARINAW